MGFTHAYGEGPDEQEGIRLVHKAFELGCNFFDTAEMYSYFENEEFVGKALRELPRDKVVISDKFWPEKLPGHTFEEDKLSEAGIRKTLEGQFGWLGAPRKRITALQVIGLLLMLGGAWVKRL